MRQNFESKQMQLVLLLFGIWSCSLILLSLLILSLKGVHANLLVVLLKGSKILTGLRELSLFHALSNVPVDKGTLGVHQVKLVVQVGPGFPDGSGVGEGADGSVDLGQVTTRDNSWWLVVDANLKQMS